MSIKAMNKVMDFCHRAITGWKVYVPTVRIETDPDGRRWRITENENDVRVEGLPREDRAYRPKEVK